MLTTTEGARVYVHIDRIVTITPSDPNPPTQSGPNHACGSTLSFAEGTGMDALAVVEYLLNIGPGELTGFLRLTDLHGLPIKVNPNYVVLVRPQSPSGSVLDVHGPAGIAEIPVRDPLDSLLDWWSVVARSRLTDPNRGW
jgi:hypothetical protein